MTLETDDPDLCPVCGNDLSDGSNNCDHLVCSLCHDGDGFDCQAPIFFGNGQMGYDFEDLFRATLKFAIEWLQAGRKHRRELEQKVTALSPDLRTYFRRAIEQLKEWKDSSLSMQEVEEVIDVDILNLQRPLEDLFDRCWKKQPGAVTAVDWEIAHSPGLTWSGRKYWATDGRTCADGIRRMVDEYTVAIQGICSSSPD